MLRWPLPFMLAGLLSACSTAPATTPPGYMGLLSVERMGGLAGYGGPGARLRSRGQIEFSALSPADQEAMDKLFRSHGGVPPSPVRDGFRYRITRGGQAGSESIEVAEEQLPAAVTDCVRDELL